jgi:hypothetical protein
VRTQPTSEICSSKVSRLHQLDGRWRAVSIVLPASSNGNPTLDHYRASDFSELPLHVAEHHRLELGFDIRNGVVFERAAHGLKNAAEHEPNQ